MDKIVIFCRRSEENERLIASIRMIFPECEIQLLSRRMECYENALPGPASGSSKNGGKANGTYPNLKFLEQLNHESSLTRR